MAIGTLIESIRSTRIRKEIIGETLDKMNQEKVEDYMAQVADVSSKSEELGAARERIRILNEITANGPTGEFFEMPWDQLLAILTNAPRGR